MEHFASLSLEELLRPEGFDCECGRHHNSSRLRKVLIEENAINKIPNVLTELSISHPFLLMDHNTKAAAGDMVCDVLAEEGIEYQALVLQGEQIEPDEHAVGTVVLALKPVCDGIVAIGSGVINDICKVVSRHAKCPQVTVATAPSMDGYASTCASMLIGGLKTSIYLSSPNAVIADINVLKNAPMRMIQAGLGDMITKFVSLPEWKLANIVHQEYWCRETSELAKKGAELCFQAAPFLAERDPGAISLLIKGLILSGICMCMVNVSGPASGGEHYVSHIWDMENIEKGHALELHGIQTGIGTLYMMSVYEHMRDIVPNREKATAFAQGFDRSKWEKDIRRLFGKGADQAIANEMRAGKHNAQKHQEQFEVILQHWPEIHDLINEIPDAKTAENIWALTGAPLSHREIGYSDARLLDAFTYSPEIRDRYIGVRLLWDIGMLEEAKGWLLESDRKSTEK